MTSVRDKNGRFARGNPGGPGRPRRVTEAEYVQALSETVTLADWRDIVLRAVADAKKGDATARNWISKHLIGDNASNLAATEPADMVFYLPVKDPLPTE